MVRALVSFGAGIRRAVCLKSRKSRFLCRWTVEGEWKYGFGALRTSLFLNKKERIDKKK